MISAVGAVEEIREFVESFAEGYGLDDFGAVGVREHPAEQEFVVNGLHRDEQSPVTRFLHFHRALERLFLKVMLRMTTEHDFYVFGFRVLRPKNCGTESHTLAQHF